MCSSYLGHFPIMRLEACERGMRNNVSAPRLTAGLKRTLRNQKTTSRPFYRGEWMEQDRNRLFFFSLSFSFPFLSLVSQHVAAPDSFHSLFLPHGKNESYTKLRAKTFVVSILIGSMMGFFGRKKLFGILTFLAAFLAGNLCTFPERFKKMWDERVFVWLFSYPCKGFKNSANQLLGLVLSSTEFWSNIRSNYFRQMRIKLPRELLWKEFTSFRIEM